VYVLVSAPWWLENIKTTPWYVSVIIAIYLVWNTFYVVDRFAKGVK
jgi:hypothetical protein